ncbi:MAG: LytTR family DNA-binding domain-containing protein [Prolixibacteraceae bacterium]|jgi:DNA-binding LytR/AlgR family response regulator
MNCIAIDDEPLALDLIKDYIEKIPFLKLERTFTNPIEGLGYLQENKVDLVFLDVELPYLSGIEFVKCLQTKPMVIFTTAYEKYALAGYDLEITDYLVKPFVFERFLKAVNKAYCNNKLNAKTPERAVAVPEKSNQSDFIMVKTGYNTINVNLNDILYIEGLKDYIKIHLAGKTILTLNSLKKLQEMLPESRFVRVHRSFIVSLPKIDSIQRNRIVIGKIFVPVGENYKSAFKDSISSINL